jgi:hypothetical protein
MSMATPIRSLLAALAAATILFIGAAALAPASAFPGVRLGEPQSPALLQAAASDDEPDDALSGDERAYGPYGRLVSLPAVLLMWWMRRQVNRGVRRLLGHGFSRMMGDVTLESPRRAAKPAGGGLFGKSTPSALEERLQRLKPEPSPYDPPPQVVAAPVSAYAGERGFGRRGVR